MVEIRELVEADLPLLAATKGGPAWHGAWDQWRTTYLVEHLNGSRLCLVAMEDGKAVGYGSLIWRPHYPPFAEAGVPEISDMVVAEDCRGLGIGSRLLAAFEARAKAAGRTTIGIGFALYADYGRAQRLYVRRGYVPDGRGVAYAGELVVPGHTYRLDDDLVLFLTKPLA